MPKKPQRHQHKPRDRSPDICADEEPSNKTRRQTPWRPYENTSNRPSRQPPSRRHRTSNTSETIGHSHENDDNHTSTSRGWEGDEGRSRYATKRRIPTVTEEDISSEEFSPINDDDEDLSSIPTFVQDMYFNADPSLMDAFGTLLGPADPFFSSSELVGNEGLNTPPHESPSPHTTPITSPETPTTPDTPLAAPASTTTDDGAEDSDDLSSPPTPPSSRTLRSSRKIPRTDPIPAFSKTIKAKVEKSTTGLKSSARRVPDENKIKIMSQNETPSPAELKERLQHKLNRRLESIEKKVEHLPVIRKEANRSNPEVETLENDPTRHSTPQTDKGAPLTNGHLHSHDTNSKNSTKSMKAEPFKGNIVNFVENYVPGERPGKLKRLCLTNFMCHDNFDEEWHHMVNYVSADNGAGKSAILAALQLVFGAKGSTTMRTKSVKELIQFGKESSKIEVTLTNDGTLQIEKYGTEICISRTLLKNGTSRYQIRTADGKSRRSLPRKELELIKATLQIMVDNPAMILNQEASRNFLRTTDPHALYNYFYRGLNLEHCEVLLMRSKDDIESCKIALDSKKKMLEELQQKAREFKAEYDLVLILENGKEKAWELNREYHWAITEQSEEKMSEMNSRLSNIVARCDELEKSLQNVMDQQNSLDTNQEATKTKLKTLKRLLQSKREDMEQSNREVNFQRQELGRIKAKLTSLDKMIGEKTERVQTIEVEVEKIRQDSESKYQERIRQIQERKETLLGLKATVKQKLAEAKLKKEDAYNKYEQCKGIVVEWHEKSGDIQYRIREKQHELNNIQQKQDTKYNRYGSDMVKLMTQIDKMVKRNEFHEPPIGPQSACYTVKEEFREYAPLIEHILGPTLFQIRVGNMPDKILLQDTLKRIYGKKKSQPEIFYQPVTSRTRYNLPNVKAASGCITVLDALDIVDDDPLVVNWLADSNSAERILLFRTEEEACKLLKEARTVPKGCSVGYSLNFKRIHADPNFRSMVINPVKTKTSYIQITSNLGNDELLRQELMELEVESQEISELLEAVKNDARVAKDWDREVDRELKGAQNELNQLETSLQGLDETFSQGPDLASYIEDSEELKTSIQQHASEKEQLDIMFEELRPKYEDTLRTRKTLDEVIESTENEIQTVEGQSDVIKLANDLRIEYKKLNEEFSSQKSARQSFKKKVAEIGVELENNLKLASTKGSRVKTSRDPSEVKEQLRCLQQHLHQNRNKLSQKGKLQDDWQQAERFANSVDHDIRIAGNLLKALIPTITLQFRKFNKTKCDYGNALQASFQTLVSARDFRGQLVIDHKDRNLMFWVCPDSNSEERAEMYRKNLETGLLYKNGMKDYISGLSGGERSFSTICFMVSMWKTMEAPFYVVDEYDVFMDQANRQTSQMILNAHTRSQPEAQFIFLTPQKLNTIIYPKNVKLLRLYPPIRDSRRLLAEDAAAAAQNTNKPKITETARQRGITKAKLRTPYDKDRNRRRVDDYYDYLYKPPQLTSAQPVSVIMC